MPRQRKPKTLKTYPSVAQMIADTHPPKVAIKFLADALQSLQQRVRTLELKVAFQGSELKEGGIFKLGAATGKPRRAVKEIRQDRGVFRRGKKKARGK